MQKTQKIKIFKYITHKVDGWNTRDKVTIKESTWAGIRDLKREERFINNSLFTEDHIIFYINRYIDIDVNDDLYVEWQNKEYEVKNIDRGDFKGDIKLYCKTSK